MKNKKFISVIWGYHKQIFSFDKDQNYHMNPLQIMKDEGYKCEIFAIDSQVKIEDDPNFIEGVNIIYYKNIFSYIWYLFKNRNNIIYSNSLTIKTLLVGLIGKKTFFMAHDQVLPLLEKKLKRSIVLFFYKFFTKIRCINSGEKKLLKSYGIHGEIIPLSIGKDFLSKSNSDRSGGIFIGNLYDDKNPLLLIDTIKKLKEFNIDFKITILGEDRYNLDGLSFKELVKKEGLDENFNFMGFVNHSKMKYYLEKSLIFINTSKSEGQCLAAFEAALAGNLLCLQNILSFPSVFNNNANYHATSTQLAKNIREYLDIGDKVLKIIRANQKLILEKYNINKINKSLLNLFKEL